MMKNEIKQKFPSWCNDTNTKYNLMLSDDLDSLFSCAILNKLFGYEIKWFYDFNNMYISDDNDNKTKSFAVDADMVKYRCWGNHVTLNNPKAANINTIMGIGQSNYTEKFCGSTLLTILSYYSADLSELSEEQKMILLTIDSTYLGYWFKDGFYCKKYLKMMELDCLLDVLERHSKEEFKELDIKYNLNKGKIWVDILDNTLHSDIQLDKLRELFPSLSFILPKNEFSTYKSFEIVQSAYLKHNREEVFSCARVYRNALRYSI
ncbi:hypothetical protein HBE96_23455 [Clostridium sp. P21]|uniref:Uncharacterized protein n=1 Tax=Clostridium muellerianum TaxID=2716538 RepID=A0A7Y0HS69_9CLOT|nr:hypothetical protein [Clostridium muellerianum]NMM65538.1 hypothetical protein [Clostridium muellerianum]